TTWCVTSLSGTGPILGIICFLVDERSEARRDWLIFLSAVVRLRCQRIKSPTVRNEACAAGRALRSTVNSPVISGIRSFRVFAGNAGEFPILRHLLVESE